MEENKMREIEIEKIVLNCGATQEKLDKSVKLLEMVTKRNIKKTTARRRIQIFGISPGKPCGAKVTIRNKKEVADLLKRFFAAIDNRISSKKIVENHASFGIHEYIEIPGLEYQRDIGILGFEVNIVFKRKGKRVLLKKIKRGKYPKKQHVQKKEIIEYLKNKFNAEVY